MHIASVAPRPVETQPATGQYVATVNYKLSDWKLTLNDRTAGDAGGYATLDAAIDAASSASAGESTGALAVLEDAGRFHLRGVDGEWFLSLNPSARQQQGEFTWLEHVALSPFPDLWKQARLGTDGTGAHFPTHDQLRAVVDGVAVLRT